MSFLNKIKEIVVGQTKEQVKQETTPTQKPIKTIIITSILIAAGSAVLLFPSDIPSLEELWDMVRVFVSAFVTQLLIEYGLKKKTSE